MQFYTPDEERQVVCRRLSKYLIVMSCFLGLREEDLAQLIGVARQTIAGYKRYPYSKMSYTVYLALRLVLEQEFKNSPWDGQKVFEILIDTDIADADEELQNIIALYQDLSYKSARAVALRFTIILKITQLIIKCTENPKEAVN